MNGSPIKQEVDMKSPEQSPSMSYWIRVYLIFSAYIQMQIIEIKSLESNIWTIRGITDSLKEIELEVKKSFGCEK